VYYVCSGKNFVATLEVIMSSYLAPLCEGMYSDGSIPPRFANRDSGRNNINNNGNNNRKIANDTTATTTTTTTSTNSTTITATTNTAAWVGVPVGAYALTLRLLMSYIYGAPSKARNANVVFIWTYVWQR